MKFVLSEKAIGKGRPRFTRRGTYVQTYTPAKTEAYQNRLKSAFLEQCKGQYDKDYTGAINIDIWAFYEPPKSCSKKKRVELLESAHLKKPDADNIAKCILDALNGVAYKDDSQISELMVHKYYDEEDKVIVKIEYLEG